MNKKLVIIFSSIISTILLIGCGSTITTSNGNDKKSENVIETDLTNQESFEENSTSTGETVVNSKRTVRLFYYNGVSDNICYEDTSIEVTDGALATAIINSLKEKQNDELCILDPSITVKNAKLDTSKDLLSINFGSKFVNNMNLGSSAEAGLLQAIINSLGYNFKVSNVYITIDGKEYASGHILKEPGETFTVDYENISKI